LHRTLDVFLNDVAQFALLLDEVDFKLLWVPALFGFLPYLVIVAIIRRQQLKI